MFAVITNIQYLNRSLAQQIMYVIYCKYSFTYHWRSPTLLAQFLIASELLNQWQGKRKLQCIHLSCDAQAD